MAKTNKQPAFEIKTVKPDPILAKVVGSQSVPRIMVTRKLWAYVKQHKLQDPKKPRTIKADPKLRAVFGGRKEVNMFTMEKLVSAHLS